MSSPAVAAGRRMKDISLSSTTSSTEASGSGVVDELLDQINNNMVQDDDDDTNTDADESSLSSSRETTIKNLINQLKANETTTTPMDNDIIDNQSNDDVSGSSSSLPSFDELIGYYNVSYTLKASKDDNPVGGKWTRKRKRRRRKGKISTTTSPNPILDGVWNIERTMQHILPPMTKEQQQDEEQETTSTVDRSSSSSISSPGLTTDVVAQVINAIYIKALWGIINIWIVLRGDAVPLALCRDANDNSSSSSSNDSKHDNKDSVRDQPQPALLPNLTNRTVRAYFDRPKIGISLFGSRENDDNNTRREGHNKVSNRWKKISSLWFVRLLLQLLRPRFVLSFGPTSNVVIDTPYVDDRIRIGVGGTSGTKFVFTRIHKENDPQAVNGWKWLLPDHQQLSSSSSSSSIVLTKTKACYILAAICSASSYAFWKLLLRSSGAGANSMVISKVACGITSIVSLLGLGWVITSTGGIMERPSRRRHKTT